MTSRLRELIQQLGEAIHESVIESEQIAGVVQDIRKQGFDVLLMLEATIGLNDVAAKIPRAFRCMATKMEPSRKTICIFCVRCEFQLRARRRMLRSRIRRSSHSSQDLTSLSAVRNDCSLFCGIPGPKIGTWGTQICSG